jgi:hypothetical protein
MGLYRSRDADKATIRLVCSSQQLPKGVHELVASARREGAQLRDKMQQTLTGLDLGEIEEYELSRAGPGAARRSHAPEPAPAPSAPPRRPSRASSRPQPDATPAASVSAAPASTSASSIPAASAPAPAAPAISAAERTQPESTAAAESASEAAESTAAAAGSGASAPLAAGTAGRDNSALAHLYTYDQLMRDYRAASTDDERQRVRERLETDSHSENSQVRYYVIRAMARLDPDVFADALKAARYDDDASVRAIAVKALEQRA